eukprot:13361949-Heterocapsa_arctica.AAC.1
MTMFKPSGRNTRSTVAHVGMQCRTSPRVERHIVVACCRSPCHSCATPSCLHAIWNGPVG